MLNYREAIESPCSKCGDSPCCCLFHMRDMRTKTLLELDTIKYYLNFYSIEILLSPGFNWSVYYSRPCRFLDLKTAECRIHNLPHQQPSVCIHYNPYHCFYKTVQTAKSGFSPDMIWINRERFDFLLSRTQFDDDRQIVGIENEGQTYRELYQIAYYPPTEDKMVFEADGTKPDAGGLENKTNIHSQEKSYTDMQQSCDDCNAFCCSNIVLPVEIPTTHTNLDYLKYNLGFPGVELGIADNEWIMTVKTSCRHLKDSKCMLYGHAERPLCCKYYDVSQCSYRLYFDMSGQPNYIKAGYEEFNRIIADFKFDAAGNIVEGLNMELLRNGSLCR